MRRYKIEDWLRFGIVLIPISIITLIILVIGNGYVWKLW